MRKPKHIFKKERKREREKEKERKKAKETFSPPAIPPKLLGLIVFCSTGSDTSSIIVFPISIALL
jgi:hypothetical protein